MWYMSPIMSMLPREMEPDPVEALLRLLIRVVARGPIQVADVELIVGPTAVGGKLRRAFNLCDGTRTQAQVVAATKIDKGQLSRAITRWETNGVLFRLGTGRHARL